MVLNVLGVYLLGPLEADPAHRRALGVADKWEALIPFIFRELCHRRVQHRVLCGAALSAGGLGVSVSAHVPEQQHLQVPEEHTAAAALQHAAAALHPSLTTRRKEISLRGMLDALAFWRYGKFNAALSQNWPTDLLIFLSIPSTLCFVYLKRLPVDLFLFLFLSSTDISLCFVLLNPGKTRHFIKYSFRILLVMSEMKKSNSPVCDQLMRIIKAHTHLEERKKKKKTTHTQT